MEAFLLLEFGREDCLLFQKCPAPNYIFYLEVHNSVSSCQRKIMYKTKQQKGPLEKIKIF
jgi:hypothetical protein